MLETIAWTYLPVIIFMLEMMGVAIICFGAIRSLITYFKLQIGKRGCRRQTDALGASNVKIMLGKSLELGLEYKMGAEIIKTLLIRDLSEIWILGAVIILRAMLSVLLHFELKSELRKSEAPSAEKDVTDAAKDM
jgi:uncharacterized membrane protein